jgi:serine/threonine protein kinase
LAAFVDRDARPMESWQLFRTLTGLAGLCATLATLHDHGVAHRCLAPAGIIALDDGRLLLRDLGLAGRGTEPGEGPAEYQAPEQRRQAQRQPGPETDVYQLAAVAYHLATGRPPLARTPLPVRAQAPGLPERAAVVLDAALVPEPSERPDVGVLGDALRAAGGELR